MPNRATMVYSICDTDSATNWPRLALRRLNLRECTGLQDCIHCSSAPLRKAPASDCSAEPDPENGSVKPYRAGPPQAPNRSGQHRASPSPRARSRRPVTGSSKLAVSVSPAAAHALQPASPAQTQRRRQRGSGPGRLPPPSGPRPP